MPLPLPRKLILVKEEIESLISQRDKLWQEYEENKLDTFIALSPSLDVFELGWELGKVDAWQDILNFIEDMESGYE